MKQTIQITESCGWLYKTWETWVFLCAVTVLCGTEIQVMGKDSVLEVIIGIKPTNCFTSISSVSIRPIYDIKQLIIRLPSLFPWQQALWIEEAWISDPVADKGSRFLRSATCIQLLSRERVVFALHAAMMCYTIDTGLLYLWLYTADRGHSPWILPSTMAVTLYFALVRAEWQAIPLGG